MNDSEDFCISPPNLFQEQKPFSFIEIPFCDKMIINQNISLTNFMSLLTVNTKY